MKTFAAIYLMLGISLSYAYDHRKDTSFTTIKQKIDFYGFAVMNDSVNFGTRIERDPKDSCFMQIIDSGFVGNLYQVKMITEFDIKEADSITLQKTAKGDFTIFLKNKKGSKIFKRSSTVLEISGGIFSPKEINFEAGTGISFSNFGIGEAVFSLLKNYQKPCSDSSR